MSHFEKIFSGSVDYLNKSRLFIRYIYCCNILDIPNFIKVYFGIKFGGFYEKDKCFSNFNNYNLSVD
jgi:hypothetical protein